MANAKKWMAQLQKLEGAVNRDYDPWSDVIRSPSPSINFTFGRTQGLPRGYVLTIFGPPRHGKSLLINSIIGQMHKDDPDAICVKYNTELREGIQLTRKDMALFSIDEARYMAFDTNEPEYIFDPICKDIAAMCEDGAPIKLLVIDSTSHIRGRRSLNADTISTQQIGDHALTMKDGLSRIVAVIRKYKIATIMTCHVAAEMDPMLQKKNGPYKMGSAYALKHASEFMMLVERDDTAGKEGMLGGRKDMLDRSFIDETLKDVDGRGEQTAVHIRGTMKESPIGVRDRRGVFTLDFKKGIVNQHEEVFVLGVNRGHITRTHNTYSFGGRQWVGKKTMIQALAQNEDLCAEIVKAIRLDDINGISRQVSLDEGSLQEENPIISIG